MTLEQLAYLSQIIGAVAVVGSLVFVGLQVHQGNRLMRDAAAREHILALQDAVYPLLENDSLFDVYIRGAYEGTKSLSEAEAARFFTYCTTYLRAWEMMHYQWRKGLIDEPSWAGNAAIIRDLMALPGFKDAWAVRMHVFNPEFRSFIVEQQAKEGAKDLYHASRLMTDRSNPSLTAYSP